MLIETCARNEDIQNKTNYKLINRVCNNFARPTKGSRRNQWKIQAGETRVNMRIVLIIRWSKRLQIIKSKNIEK